MSKIIKFIILITVMHFATCILIQDLKKRPVALFVTGDLKIKTGDLKIIYKVDISKLRMLLAGITTNIKADQPILDEISKIKELINRITPYASRVKRWDQLGSFYKLIAGIPDANDLRYIEGELEKLRNNNNVQLQINSQIQAKINEMTKGISHEAINNLIVISQLKELRTQIEAIQDAVTLAKRQIVSHKLLTGDEVFLLAETLGKAGVKLSMPEQALNFVTPTIIADQGTLNYILTVPKFKPTTFKTYLVEPIAIHQEIVDLPGKTYALSFPMVYRIPEQLETYLDFVICKEHEMKLINKQEFIWKIVTGGIATCQFKKIPADYKRITEVTESMVLVNDNEIVVKSSSINRTLNGAYLIDFTNDTIFINDREYTSKIIKNNQHPIYKQRWQPRIIKEEITPLDLENIKEITPQTTRKTDWPNFRNPEEMALCSITLLIVLTILLGCALSCRCGR